ncbi:hypothetical protein, partial [Maricaulis sp.]|uniref:hypothetical protein n=1 Tax=Maricaulis sp. TaxID=1486257 RepID=UPI003297B049
HKGDDGHWPLADREARKTSAALQNKTPTESATPINATSNLICDSPAPGGGEEVLKRHQYHPHFSRPEAGSREK